MSDFLGEGGSEMTQNNWTLEVLKTKELIPTQYVRYFDQIFRTTLQNSDPVLLSSELTYLPRLLDSLNLRIQSNIYYNFRTKSHGQ